MGASSNACRQNNVTLTLLDNCRRVLRWKDIACRLIEDLSLPDSEKAFCLRWPTLEFLSNSYWSPVEVQSNSKPSFEFLSNPYWSPIGFLLDSCRFPIEVIQDSNPIHVDVLAKSCWIAQELLVGSMKSSFKSYRHPVELRPNSYRSPTGAASNAQRP